MTSTPVLIVGTGRCGSTMLSDIIRRHPEVLSISELLITTTRFCKNIEGAFPRHRVSGHDFWTIQTVVSPEVTALLRSGLCFSEMIYPLERPGMMFNAETGIPAIMQAMLPHLTDHPDKLYAQLETVMLARPEASLREHYDAMFGWLMNHFGKRVWVERSGGSTYILDRLLELYPDARVVHIVRDGIPTALSMSQHSGYRLLLGLEKVKRHLRVDPFLSDDREFLHAVPQHLLGLLPERFDGAAVAGLDIPIEAFGTSWSDHVVLGFEALNAVPSDRRLNVRYETLCADPVAQVRRLMTFVGVPSDTDWLETVATGIRNPGRAGSLLSAAQEQPLKEACEPGMRLILDKILDGAFV